MKTMHVLNGWRVYDGVDPFRMVSEVRAHLWPLYQRRLTEHLANGVANIIDRETLGLDTVGTFPMPLVEAYERVHSLWRRRRFLDFEVVWLTDPRDGRPYLLVSTYGQDEYERAFEDIGLAERWPYWDDETSPPPVAPYEWSHRRDVWWNALQGGTADPSLLGWRWQMLSKGPAPVPAGQAPALLVHAAIPDIHTRASVIAREMAMTDASPAPDSGGDAPDMDWVASAMATYGKSLDQYVMHIEPQLTDITVDMVVGAIDRTVR